MEVLTAPSNAAARRAERGRPARFIRRPHTKGSGGGQGLSCWLGIEQTWSLAHLTVRVPARILDASQPVAACKGRVAELGSGFPQAPWRPDLSSRGVGGTARASAGGAPAQRSLHSWVISSVSAVTAVASGASELCGCSHLSFIPLLHQSLALLVPGPWPQLTRLWDRDNHHLGACVGEQAAGVCGLHFAWDVRLSSNVDTASSEG